MKIGDIDIKKAYLGSLELTNKNSFIGEVPVIPTPIPTIIAPKNLEHYSTSSAYKRGTITETDSAFSYNLNINTTWSTFGVGLVLTFPYEVETVDYNNVQLQVQVAKDSKCNMYYGRSTIKEPDNSSLSKILPFNGSYSRTLYMGTIRRPEGVTEGSDWYFVIKGSSGINSSATSTTKLIVSFPKFTV